MGSSLGFISIISTGFFESIGDWFVNFPSFFLTYWYWFAVGLGAIALLIIVICIARHSAKKKKKQKQYADDRVIDAVPEATFATEEAKIKEYKFSEVEPKDPEPVLSFGQDEPTPPIEQKVAVASTVEPKDKPAQSTNAATPQTKPKATTATKPKESVATAKPKTTSPAKSKTAAKPKTEGAKKSTAKTTAKPKTVSKEATAPATHSSEKEDESTVETGVYRVVYDKENYEWVIRKNTSSRAIRRVKTKVEALEIAKHLSNTQDAALTVHKKDGKFQKQ